MPDEQLARLMGIDYWHVGNRRVMGGPREGEPVAVRYLWRLDVDPSFSTSWSLAGLSGDGGGTRRASFRRVGWAHPDGAFLTEVGADPVAVALNEVRLVAPELPDWVTLDGVSYRIRFQTHHLDGELWFSNPQWSALVGVERAAFRVARELARTVRSRLLAECLVVWRSCVGEGLAEPSAAPDPAE